MSKPSANVWLSTGSCTGNPRRFTALVSPAAPANSSKKKRRTCGFTLGLDVAVAWHTLCLRATLGYSSRVCAPGTRDPSDTPGLEHSKLAEPSRTESSLWPAPSPPASGTLVLASLMPVVPSSAWRQKCCAPFPFPFATGGVHPGCLGHAMALCGCLHHSHAWLR